MSKSPLLIQVLVNNAIRIVSAFKELRKSTQMCRDFKNVLSTETLVAGIAR